METFTTMETEPTYQEFQGLPDWQRMKIAAENRIINTDTYNRTMDHLRGPEGWREEETYVLQMRRSPYDYLVAAGIEDVVTELTSKPITQAELDLADQFFTEQDTPFWNKEMWQTVIDDYDGYLPIEIHGMLDGTVALPGEPMLRFTGPGELVAHFEHLFHRAFYSTLVATKAHEIRQIVGDPSRFIEVGKRSTPDELTHLMAMKAMQVGGGFGLTSNDAAAATFESIKPVGTIGHRYVQRFESVEAAFRHAVENLDAVSLLVDLVDSYQGLDTALQLKEEYRETGKRIWVRLDSGNLIGQTRYYLEHCKMRGFTDPILDKIVIEGFETLEDIRAIETTLTEEEKQRVIYGAGGLLVSEKTARSDASTGFKLSEYVDDQGLVTPSMKFSDSPGKRSIPGKPTVAVVAGQRLIAQEGEVFPDQDLLPLLYGAMRNRQTTPLAAAYERCEAGYQALHEAIESNKRTEFSLKTAQKIGQVMLRYGLAQ